MFCTYWIVKQTSRIRMSIPTILTCTLNWAAEYLFLNILFWSTKAAEYQYTQTQHLQYIERVVYIFQKFIIYWQTPIFFSVHQVQHVCYIEHCIMIYRKDMVLLIEAKSFSKSRAKLLKSPIARDPYFCWIWDMIWFSVWVNEKKWNGEGSVPSCWKRNRN